MSMKPRAALKPVARALQRTVATTVSGALVALTLLPAPVAWAQAARTARSPSADAVTLNFVNADIEGVARAMGAILKQQFVVDPRVRGNITLFSEQPLSPRDAYLSFLAALRGLGFTVVEVGGLQKVVPEADAKLQTGTVSVGDVSRRGDQVITQIFRLSYESANNLVPVLRPLISPNNTINANPGNNTLVITDYADNLQRLGKIIAAMDTPSGGDVEVVTLQHAVASDVAALVQRLSDGGGGAAVPGAPGAPGSSAPSILVDQRSNSLIVRTSNPARMASVRSLIAKLDQPLQGAGAIGNIWVVHLKNADATRLAAVLRAAFASSGGASGGGAGGGAASLSPMTSPSATAAGANAAGAPTAATAPIAPSAAPSTGGFIQADPATNSLVVTAPEPLYRQVRAMIDQLDSRRAQVYIESMIVEVSGDNAADFGFQWQGLIGKIGDTNIPIGGTNFNVGNSGGNNIIPLTGGLVGGSLAAAATAAAGLSEGLNIGLVRNYGGIHSLAAIARILQSQTNTNIVSTPNLITLDNEEAKIIVGSNVPFVTGQFTNTGTATTSPFQTIERKDVGITLRIRPQIGENGVVRMTIFQESSSLSDKVAPGTSNAGPSTNKRSIESNVVVDDGQIIVLGGLIEDRYNENKSKVPVLGDIPYLGGLFRSETRTKTRTNLMVFLRPVVMRDAESTNKLSMDRYELIRAQQKDSQPTPSVLLPINEAPVVPPLRPPEVVPAPLAVPPSSPRTEPNPLARPPVSQPYVN
jgi:general secretion pathway protein D